MKQRIRLTEGDLHRIVKEAIVKESRKKAPKKGKIKFNNEWVDATEDKPDRYGNPMFKIKDGGKTKRVQNFNFRPEAEVKESVIRLTEGDLHRIVKESVKKVIREMNGNYPEWGQQSQKAMGFNPEITQNKADSLRRYWASKGLSGEELERKVQTILHNQSGMGSRY